MNWKKRLKTDEAQLKALIDRLNETQEGGLLSRGEHELALRTLTLKLAQMRSYVEDCMSGRSEYEKSVLEYKLRVEYPLFAHLASLATVSRKYVEWSYA